MDLDAFISEAIDKAAQFGISTQSPLERSVYLISEAEICCDMGTGIDYIYRTYGREGVQECADAYEHIQAKLISQVLRRIRFCDDQIDEDSTESAHSLISNRTGYDYSSIRSWVAARLNEPSP